MTGDIAEAPVELMGPAAPHTPEEREIEKKKQETRFRVRICHVTSKKRITQKKGQQRFPLADRQGGP
jgi:hypothetical protein